MTSEQLVTRLGIAALIGCGILSGAIELFLIPLYDGASLVPITVAFAIGGNVLLLYLGRELAPDTGWRLSPFAGWLLTVLVFSLFTRPEGDVIVPGGGGGIEWVGYGVLLGGALSGTVAAVMLSPSPRPRTTAAAQSAEAAGPAEPTGPAEPAKK